MSSGPLPSGCDGQRYCWPEDLVDEHAGEDADEDPDDGEAEHGAETGVDSAVYHLAAGRSSEHVPQSRWNKNGLQKYFMFGAIINQYILVEIFELPNQSWEP